MVLHGRRIGGWSRSAFALLAALAVLLSVVLGGHRYFYCALMDEVSLDSCCAPAPRSGSEEAPAIDRDACCATKHFAATAPGAIGGSSPIARAPLVAVLAVPAAPDAPTLPALASLGRFARAGPGDPSPRAHRLRLMVFLT